jgi:hypothetical protein
MIQFKDKTPFLGLMAALLVAMVLLVSWATSQLAPPDIGLSSQTYIKITVGVFIVAFLFWSFAFFRGLIPQVDSTKPRWLCFVMFFLWFAFLALGIVLMAVVLGMAVGVLAQSAATALTSVVMPVVAVVSLYVFLRFSALLPASASGTRLKLGACWHEAKGIARPWLVLAILLALMIILFGRLSLGWVGEASIQAAFLFLVFLTIVLIYKKRDEA